MKVLIIYAHPSENSFTCHVKDKYIESLLAAGHQYELSDLYQMNFNETFSEDEYLREAFYDDTRPVSADVLEEQRKIQTADMITFIYPVFWTEAPAKLVGWFQRVWTYEFAYGLNAKMKLLSKALFLVTMGGSLKDEVRRKQVEAMQVVMLGDRINQRAIHKEMIVFDEMTRGYGNEQTRAKKQERYLKQVIRIGKETGIETNAEVAEEAVTTISKDELLDHLDQLHTTELGSQRIKKNLAIQVCDVVGWCRQRIQWEDANIFRKGKNWYICVDGAKITVNAYNYSIITAHRIDV